MGARHMNDGYTDTLDGVIVALCKDYCHRRASSDELKYSKRTLMEYDYINSILIRAASEIVGADDAETIISEIGDRVGYAYSSVGEMCESTYKNMKKEVKLNIAKKLHMIG